MKDWNFKNSTIGLMASHEKLPKPQLLRVEYYLHEQEPTIKLMAVSGNSLMPVRAVCTVNISREEYADRPHDPYDSIIEARWAFEKLGCDIG